MIASLPLFSALSAALLVWVLRGYALRRGVVDLPNDRGSHDVPTPRGGGLGLIVPVALTIALLPTPIPKLAQGLSLTGIVLVASLGWVDDHASLSVRVRLAGHGVAGVLVALIASSLGAEPFDTWAVPAAIAGGWWVLWTISSINVVNFADGIDGLMGLLALVFAGFVALACGFGSTAGHWALALGGASLGFLVFNWSPARIFMGDVGSGSLGLLFVLLGILTIRELEWSIVHAYYPLMPTFVDEVLTMSRRVRRGEAIWKAHRTHVYQRLVQAGWGHAPITLFYGGLAVVAALWPFTYRESTVMFWTGAGAGLVLCFVILWLCRAWAERVMAARTEPPGLPRRTPDTGSIR